MNSNKLSTFLNYIPFYLRRRTSNKIVVIESDDWGQERALNAEALGWAARKYGRESFTRWTTDSLETDEDLILLFELFDTFKDCFQFAPVLTANFITHNIDYQNDSKMSFLSIEESIKNNNPALFKIYEYGIEHSFFKPQLHGYSHFNLERTRSYFNTDEGMEAYQNKFFYAKSTIIGNTSFLEGECTTANPNYEAQLLAAQQAFCNTFGYYSETFIPPRFIIDRGIISMLRNYDIKFLQAGSRLIDSRGIKYSRPFYRSYLGQIWLNRNCRLDPHQDYNYSAEQCITAINSAFGNEQPAVIDFHRVNIAGRFTPEYRAKSLSELKKVFDYLKRYHPDTIFTTSNQLLRYF